jgi:hypothetical protein
MYSVINNLLADKKDGVSFACFDAFHCCFMAAVLASVVIYWLILKDQHQSVKQKAITLCINTAFGLYIADFFLMPLAYGAIDIEKLPFHICTAMCVACFLSRHNQTLFEYRLHFAVYGLISNLVYLIYPAGVMWHQVQPFTYRVIQTLVFHGVMVVYGFLVLLFDEYQWNPRKCHRDFAVIAAMTLWAMLGNWLYNGECGFFNWFFVIRDPFHLISGDIAPYLMPFLNITIFFAAAMLVHFICSLVRNRIQRCRT